MAAELLRMKRAKMRGGRAGREGRECKEEHEYEVLLMGRGARGESQVRGGVRPRGGKAGRGEQAMKVFEEKEERPRQGLMLLEGSELAVRISESFHARSARLDRVKQQMLKDLIAFPNNRRDQTRHGEQRGGPSVLGSVQPQHALSWDLRLEGIQTGGPDDVVRSEVLGGLREHADCVKEFVERRGGVARLLSERLEEVAEAKKKLRWRLREMSLMDMRREMEGRMEVVGTSCVVGYYKFKRLMEVMIQDERRKLVENSDMNVSSDVYENVSWRIFSLRLMIDHPESPRLVRVGRCPLHKNVVRMLSKRLRNKMLEDEHVKVWLLIRRNNVNTTRCRVSSAMDERVFENEDEDDVAEMRRLAEKLDTDNARCGFLYNSATGLDSLLQEMIFGSSKDDLPKEERLMSRRPGEQSGPTYLRDLTRHMKFAICCSAPHVKLSSRVLTWLLHRNHAVFSIRHVDPFIYFFDDDRWNVQASRPEQDRSGFGQLSGTSLLDLDWTATDGSNSKLRVATVSHLKELVRCWLKGSDALQELLDPSIVTEFNKAVGEDGEGGEGDRFYINDLYILYTAGEKSCLKKVDLLCLRELITTYLFRHALLAPSAISACARTRAQLCRNSLYRDVRNEGSSTGQELVAIRKRSDAILDFLKWRRSRYLSSSSSSSSSSAAAEAAASPDRSPSCESELCWSVTCRAKDMYAEIEFLMDRCKSLSFEMRGGRSMEEDGREGDYQHNALMRELDTRMRSMAEVLKTFMLDGFT
ncbi:hypothetical protein GUITHDRAFT_138821 [Guillardia theta CCMP2712]|uniref:Uncharacterized protein n=2 Tax=Guillardia theta TaxID=55529 RepID=L1JB92_GUITC|nr:hypothetical protein GUITHDRAFT_138821 [Guillardia theta CCMP2712]EKX45597.1 hypothetical protein GUITHDRAFT_138821 [Guillardia theta CCMP2712]|eukprot:XP_005832577.1 hypothetical protein GUITHDRAFT_138821 [Guillardia theta CCMP2712]